MATDGVCSASRAPPDAASAELSQRPHSAALAWRPPEQAEVMLEGSWRRAGASGDEGEGLQRGTLNPD